MEVGGGGSPVTTVAISADHHDQSTGHRNAQKSTCQLKYRVLCHTESTSVFMFCVIRSSLISVHSSVTIENRTCVHRTCLTGNVHMNEVQKYCHEVSGQY
jgi:hypothetical protein